MTLSAFALTVFLSQPAAPVEPIAPHAPTLPLVVFAASTTADWISTYQQLTVKTPYYTHTNEINPFINWAQRSPKRMIAFGAALDAAGVWGWYRWTGKRHPKVYATGLYLASIWRVYWMAKNIQMIHYVQRPPGSK